MASIKSNKSVEKITQKEINPEKIDLEQILKSITAQKHSETKKQIILRKPRVNHLNKSKVSVQSDHSSS